MLHLMQCQLEQFCQTTKGLGWKMCKSPSILLVYVIGLHAVQFGNNWMKKILRTAKIWLSEEFFNPIISKLDKHVVLLLINYIASEEIQLI